MAPKRKQEKLKSYSSCNIATTPIAKSVPNAKSIPNKNNIHIPAQVSHYSTPANRTIYTASSSSFSCASSDIPINSVSTPTIGDTTSNTVTSEPDGVIC